MTYKQKVTHEAEVYGVDLSFETMKDGSVFVEETSKNGQEDSHMFGTIRFSETDNEWIWCEVEGENFSKWDSQDLADDIVAFVNKQGPPTVQIPFEQVLRQASEECKKYEGNCIHLSVSEAGQSVELVIGDHSTYSKPAEGIRGGDCGLICRMDTDEVIGIHLGVYTDKLTVHHTGPIRINTGFRKDQSP